MPPHKLFTQGVVFADENIHKLSPFGGKTFLQGTEFNSRVWCLGFVGWLAFFCFSWKSVVFLFVVVLFWVVFVFFWGFCLFLFVCCFVFVGEAMEVRAR